MIVPALFLLASILPPSIDDWKRADAAKPEIPLPSVAREYGLPAVANIDGVTETLHEGEQVTVDGDAGTVSRTS